MKHSRERLTLPLSLLVLCVPSAALADEVRAELHPGLGLGSIVNVADPAKSPAFRATYDANADVESTQAGGHRSVRVSCRMIRSSRDLAESRFGSVGAFASAAFANASVRLDAGLEAKAAESLAHNKLVWIIEAEVETSSQLLRKWNLPDEATRSALERFPSAQLITGVRRGGRVRLLGSAEKTARLADSSFGAHLNFSASVAGIGEGGLFANYSSAVRDIQTESLVDFTVEVEGGERDSIAKLCTAGESGDMAALQTALRDWIKTLGENNACIVSYLTLVPVPPPAQLPPTTATAQAEASATQLQAKRGLLVEDYGSLWLRVFDEEALISAVVAAHPDDLPDEARYVDPANLTKMKQHIPVLHRLAREVRLAGFDVLVADDTKIDLLSRQLVAFEQRLVDSQAEYQRPSMRLESWTLYRWLSERNRFRGTARNVAVGIADNIVGETSAVDNLTLTRRARDLSVLSLRNVGVTYPLVHLSRLNKVRIDNSASEIFPDLPFLLERNTAIEELTVLLGVTPSAAGRVPYFVELPRMPRQMECRVWPSVSTSTADWPSIFKRSSALTIIAPIVSGSFVLNGTRFTCKDAAVSIRHWSQNAETAVGLDQVTLPDMAVRVVSGSRIEIEINITSSITSAMLVSLQTQLLPRVVRICRTSPSWERAYQKGETGGLFDLFTNTQQAFNDLPLPIRETQIYGVVVNALKSWANDRMEDADVRRTETRFDQDGEVSRHLREDINARMPEASIQEIRRTIFGQ